jgi:hypothetical protein
MYRQIPGYTALTQRVGPTGEVMVGSCATTVREPGQDREVAAFNGSGRAPQIAWPSPHSAGLTVSAVATSPL